MGASQGHQRAEDRHPEGNSSLGVACIGRCVLASNAFAQTYFGVADPMQAARLSLLVESVNRGGPEAPISDRARS